MPWKYIGEGSFLTGVPHDPDELISDEDFAEIAKAFEEREGVPLQEAPEFSTLYERVNVPPERGGPRPAPPSSPAVRVNEEE